MSTYLSQQITQNLEKLRQLTQINVQTNWCYFSEDLPIDSINISHWQKATVNEKGYITWKTGSKVQWLAQNLIIPDHLQGYSLTGLSLRLVMTWWAEFAQIFVNGQLVQEGDLFDSSARILLTSTAIPGQEILVALRLISPKHDIGALMQAKCVYEKEIDPGFVADELTVLQKYLENFAPEKLEILAAEINQIDWNIISDTAKCDRFLADLKTNLYPLAVDLKKRQLHLLGHAHLDMAWLWTVDETWEVAQRTFSSVLNLQQDNPHLTFCHSTSVLYAWLEKHRPDLFAAIQTAVSQGKWEIVGGMWVEPEVNIISGESLVRQLLYGQRYILEKFGAITEVAWLPDSFGFSWQLPQIFSQSGIKYFVTGKLHWNDTNTFPHGFFWWQSPDGSRVLTLVSPPNVTGVMDTNPLTMTNYAVAWEKQTGFLDIFWLPGVGDHGGGPSRDMLEVQHRWQNSSFFPSMQFTTAIQYLQQLPKDSLPIWDDELYLEFHRGCYTTHAEQKFFNRYCEGLLYQAELFSSLVYLLFAEGDNPLTDILSSCQEVKEKIEQAWKKLLFNQFHDILPGTSIEQVFVEANQQWQEVINTGEEILIAALMAIAVHINYPSPPHQEAKPLLIFNPLNWQRSEVVELAMPSENWGIYNLEGEEIPSQLSNQQTRLFIARDIPSVGYRLFWLCPLEGKKEKEEGKKDFILENEQLRVIVDPETGDLSSIFDKIHHREILSGAGNQLQAFQDQGQYWDAWNIDPNYAQHRLPPPRLKSIEWLNTGSIEQSIRVVRQIGQSSVRQDYRLASNTNIIKIVTKVDWQESHVLLKAAFPLNLESDRVSYEIPCGVIERPTDSQAKWEVSALRWACLYDEKQQYGVSLINNCKYGYDSQPQQLRLTLLRSPSWPDAKADRGIHEFTYALSVHQGNWQSARTVHKGYELNLPLITMLVKENLQQLPKILAPMGQLLSLGADNLILMALKPSEDDGWILRCYESIGQSANISLESDGKLAIAEPVNLLEVNYEQQEKTNTLGAWKIASFRIKKGD